jgi:PST family polysaccharide transporter
MPTNNSALREPSLRKNVVSLYALQIASYAAPLATLPWLTRVLGPAGFGRLAFCAAVTGYLVVFTDFGFNYSATRQIAQCWNDRLGRSTVFWNTLTAKALLASLGLPLLLVLTLIIPRFAQERTLLLVNYLTVLATVLSPTWYFQGTERQVALSSITIAVRLVAIPLLFWLVRTPQQVLMAAWISSGTQLLGGLACMAYLVQSNELDRAQIRFRGIARTFAEGWHLFISMASISLYTTTNTVILGFVCGSAAVGHYSAAEKMIQAAQGLLIPVNQSAYPRVSRLMQESREAAFALVRKVLRIQGLIALSLSLVLFAIAPLIIRILYGAAFEETINVLRWLAWVPFIVGLSNVFGVHVMTAMGMNKTVSRILISAGAVNLVILFACVRSFGATGAAASVVASELMVTVAMLVIILKHNLPIFRAIPAM